MNRLLTTVRKEIMASISLAGCATISGMAIYDMVAKQPVFGLDKFSLLFCIGAGTLIFDKLFKTYKNVQTL